MELPPGTTSDDMAQILVYRVVNGTPDPGYSVHVTGVTRAFFLGGDHLPQASFLSWAGSPNPDLGRAVGRALAGDLTLTRRPGARGRHRPGWPTGPG